jgi:hypothetical protein
MSKRTIPRDVSELSVTIYPQLFSDCFSLYMRISHVRVLAYIVVRHQ